MNQKFSSPSTNRLLKAFKASPSYSINLQKNVQQVDNQKRVNNNIMISTTRNNQYQFNDYQELLQCIEDLLEKNREKYQTQIVNNIDQFLNEYRNLQWLMSILFEQRQRELTHSLIREQKVIDEYKNKSQLENQQKQIQDNVSQQYQQQISRKKQKINTLKQRINEQKIKIKSDKDLIEEKQRKINLLDDEIINLKQNAEAMKQQIEKKDQIFQETLKETKQMSAKALISLNIEHQWTYFRNADLQTIQSKEKEINDNTIEINQEIDQVLIRINQNPQDQQIQQKKQSLMEKCQSIKNQIKTVKGLLEQYIQKQKQIWGSAKQADSALNQQVKHNLEFMITYSKLFDNFFETAMKLIEKSNEYEQQNCIVITVADSGTPNHNFSIFLQNQNQDVDKQLLYAHIPTRSFDIVLLSQNIQQQKILDLSQQVYCQQYIFNERQ